MTDKFPICIKSGTLVQVYFKNGTSLAGIVVNWSNENVILQAPNGDNNILIYYPADNLLMVKIINSGPSYQAVDYLENNTEVAPPVHVEHDSKARSSDLKERTKEKVQGHLESNLNQRKNFASRMRNTAPKNIAPQVERYKTPWE